MSLPPDLPLQKPKTLLVLGILNLAFTAFGFFGLMSSVMILVKPDMYPGNPMHTILENDPAYATYYKGLLAISFILLPVQVIAGIGLIKAREWARKLTILLAITAVVVALVNIWISYTHVNGAVMAEAMKDQGSDATTQKIMEVTMTVSLALGVLVAAGWAILQSILLTRPRVRAYCKALSGK